MKGRDAMTAAPTPTDRPELVCWLCGNLGAIRKAYSSGGVAWLPFQFDPVEKIRLDRGEHVCPACHGIHNPRRTTFPIGGAP
jgi:hypothetical protein